MVKMIFAVMVAVLVVIPMFNSCTPSTSTPPPVTVDNQPAKPQAPALVDNKPIKAEPAISEQEIATLAATDTQGILKYSGQKVRVKGTVVEFTSIYNDNKRPILICFTNKGSHVITNDDWQQSQAGTDFKAVLYKEFFPQFPALDEYYDDEVIVEGIVDTLKGAPVIMLKSASQIQYVNKQPTKISMPDSLKNTKIAFVSDRTGNPDPHFYSGDGQGEIFTMNADGSDVVQLTDSGGKNRAPAWSPDGKKIAFMSNRANSGLWNIFVMNADGTDVTNLTDKHANNITPNWSPDGAEIVFASDFWGDATNVCTMNSDGTNIKQVTNMARGQSAFCPSYSRDGKELFYMSNGSGSFAITKTDLSPGNLTNLTQLNKKSSVYPNVSPVEGKIVYSGDTANRIDLNNPQIDIFVLTTATGDNVQLTSTSVNETSIWNQYPAWSPDGTKIVFSSNRSQGIWQQFGIDTPITQLYVMDPDGKNVYRIPYIWGNNWDATWK